MIFWRCINVGFDCLISRERIDKTFYIHLSAHNAYKIEINDCETNWQQLNTPVKNITL